MKRAHEIRRKAVRNGDFLSIPDSFFDAVIEPFFICKILGHTLQFYSFWKDVFIDKL